MNGFEVNVGKEETSFDELLGVAKSLFLEYSTLLLSNVIVEADETSFDELFETTESFSSETGILCSLRLNVSLLVVPKLKIGIVAVDVFIPVVLVVFFIVEAAETAAVVNGTDSYFGSSLGSIDFVFLSDVEVSLLNVDIGEVPNLKIKDFFSADDFSTFCFVLLDPKSNTGVVEVAEIELFEEDSILSLVA